MRFGGIYMCVSFSRSFLGDWGDKYLIWGGGRGGVRCWARREDRVYVGY